MPQMCGAQGTGVIAWVSLHSRGSLLTREGRVRWGPVLRTAQCLALSPRYSDTPVPKWSPMCATRQKRLLSHARGDVRTSMAAGRLCQASAFPSWTRGAAVVVVITTSATWGRREATASDWRE